MRREIPLDYWSVLAQDPEPGDARAQLEALTGDPAEELEAGTTTCFFSPRKTSKMLDWYSRRVSDANGAILYTGGFGVTDKLALALAGEKDFLRYLLLEKPLTAKAKKLLGTDRGIVTVYGNVLGEVWVANKKGELTIRRPIPIQAREVVPREEHFASTRATSSAHEDPDDRPAIVRSPGVLDPRTSPASLTANDENMLLIRGDPRVADIYMTEIDRMLRHFQFRNIAADLHDQDPGKSIFLDESDKWLKPYFKSGGFKDRRRRMFFPE